MINYQAAHKRTQAARGRASRHACALCGQPARDWALTTVGPVMIDPAGRFYSDNPDDYSPMCRACHMTVDIGRDTCLRGHPLPGDNPRRACRTCRRELDGMVARAAKVLGLSQRQYVAQHGAGRAAADALVRRAGDVA